MIAEKVQRTGVIDTEGYNAAKIIGMSQDTDRAFDKLRYTAAEIADPISFSERKLLRAMLGLSEGRDYRTEDLKAMSREDRSAGMSLTIEGPALLQKQPHLSRDRDECFYVMYPEGLLIGNCVPRRYNLEAVSDIREWADAKQNHSLATSYGGTFDFNPHKAPPYSTSERFFAGSNSRTAANCDVLQLDDNVRLFIPGSSRILKSHCSGTPANMIRGAAFECADVTALDPMVLDKHSVKETIDKLRALPAEQKGEDSYSAILRSKSDSNLYFSLRSDPCWSIVIFDSSVNHAKIQTFSTPLDMARYWLNIGNHINSYTFENTKLSVL